MLLQKSEKLEKAGTVDFKRIPHGRRGQGPGSVDPRFPAGLPFPVPQILEFVALCDSGTFFQQFSRNFPGTFLQNSRKDPGNSHSHFEFSELGSGVVGTPPNTSLHQGCKFREVSAYFREVSAYFREVSTYFREVSAYFRSETSFQNFKQVSRNSGLLWQPGVYNDTKTRACKRGGCKTYFSLSGVQTVLQIPASKGAEKCPCLFRKMQFSAGKPICQWFARGMKTHEWCSCSAFQNHHIHHPCPTYRLWSFHLPQKIHPNTKMGSPK